MIQKISHGYWHKQHYGYDVNMVSMGPKSSNICLIKLETKKKHIIQIILNETEMCMGTLCLLYTQVLVNSQGDSNVVCILTLISSFMIPNRMTEVKKIPLL